MILQHHEAYISHFIFIFFLIRWFLTTFTPSGNMTLIFFLEHEDFFHWDFFSLIFPSLIYFMMNFLVMRSKSSFLLSSILFMIYCWSVECHATLFFLTSTSWWLFILISWVISDLMSSSSGNLVKGIKPNSQPVRNKKNRENTHQRKTITRTRQYLRGLTICLRPRSCRDITIIREEYRVQHAATIFSLYI